MSVAKLRNLPYISVVIFFQFSPWICHFLPKYPIFPATIALNHDFLQEQMHSNGTPALLDETSCFLPPLLVLGGILEDSTSFLPRLLDLFRTIGVWGKAAAFLRTTIIIFMNSTFASWGVKGVKGSYRELKDNSSFPKISTPWPNQGKKVSSFNSL